MEQVKWFDKSYLGWLTLFASGSTLICCALPILLVYLGFGAMVASLNYNIPGLVFLAENKLWTLGASALLLVALAWINWRPGQGCPANPDLAALCRQARRWNNRIFWLSAALWGTGAFFSYLLLPLRKWLDV